MQKSETPCTLSEIFISSTWANSLAGTPRGFECHDSHAPALDSSCAAHPALAANRGSCRSRLALTNLSPPRSHRRSSADALCAFAVLSRHAERARRAHFTTRPRLARALTRAVRSSPDPSRGTRAPQRPRERRRVRRRQFPRRRIDLSTERPPRATATLLPTRRFRTRPRTMASAAAASATAARFAGVCSVSGRGAASGASASSRGARGAVASRRATAGIAARLQTPAPPRARLAPPAPRSRARA